MLFPVKLWKSNIGRISTIQTYVLFLDVSSFPLTRWMWPSVEGRPRACYFPIWKFAGSGSIQLNLTTGCAWRATVKELRLSIVGNISNSVTAAISYTFSRFLLVSSHLITTRLWHQQLGTKTVLLSQTQKEGSEMLNSTIITVNDWGLRSGCVWSSQLSF